MIQTNRDSGIYQFLVAALLVCTALTPAIASDKSPESILNALETMAEKAARAPGDCDAIRAEAAAFRKTFGDQLESLSTSQAPSGPDIEARLDAVRDKLSASAMICGSCPAESNAAPQDDPCKDTKKKCERNCPLSGWHCTQHWMGCMSGYRPSCCWAAACGSKKNCMRVCESSCLCSL